MPLSFQNLLEPVTETSAADPSKLSFSSMLESVPQTSAPETPSIPKTGANPFGLPSTGAIPNYISGVGEDFTSAAKSLMGNDTGGDRLSTIPEAITGGLDTAAKVTGAVLSPITRAISPVLQPIIQKMGDNVTKDPGVTAVLNHVNDLIDKYPVAAQDMGNLFQTFMNVSGLVSAPEGVKIAGKVANEAGNIASDAGTLTKNAVQSVLPEAKPAILDESAITDRYNRAIKPSVAGKSNATQIAKANSNVVSGLKAISDNKSALEFTDDTGNVIKGETPKTVGQLSEAIQQTKKSIYDKYDALAQEAGGKGISVNTNSIAGELDSVVQSKSLQLANPRAVNYAKQLQQRLQETGTVDAKTAQEVIQHYNESLKAFYRNPSYDTASEASIDALVANKLRAQLDEGITGATGEKYQALKNQYGALKSMETDVARRTSTLSKASPQGLISTLSNISSGVELVKGLATLSPTKIITSGAIKGIQLYMKYLNNPDVGVAKIFSEIEKSNPSSIGNMSVPATGGIKPSLSSPKPTTFQPKSKLGQAIQEAKRTSGTQGGKIGIGRITPELNDAVSKELNRYDPTPLKVNGKLDLSDSNIDFRLSQLKDIVNKRALKPSEVTEAKDLLGSVGIKIK